MMQRAFSESTNRATCIELTGVPACASALCREVEDAFCQVSEYKESDDLETLKGIQVPIKCAHHPCIYISSPQLMYRTILAHPFDTGVSMKSADGNKGTLAACRNMHHDIAHAQVSKSHSTCATAYVNLHASVVFFASFDQLTSLWPAYRLCILTAVGASGRQVHACAV